MTRKSQRETMVEGIRQRLTEMREESRLSVEKAIQHAQMLSDLGLAGESDPEDFDVCPGCGLVRYKKKCEECS